MTEPVPQDALEQLAPQQVLPGQAARTAVVSAGADLAAVVSAGADLAGADLAGVVDRLAAFSDPTRLRLLIAIHAAPGSPVKELAAATALAPNTVSQALVPLRAAGLVQRVQEGRLARWTLSDVAAHELLHHLGAPHSSLHPPH